jgi:hypothetical protein
VVPGWEKALWAMVGVAAWARSWSWSGRHDPTLHLALRGMPGADPAVAAQPVSGGV